MISKIKNAKELEGCFVAIATPMRRGGDAARYLINYDAAYDLVDYVLSNGTDGIVICGCTGQDALLTERGQMNFIKEISDIVKKEYPEKIVIAGDGANATHEARGRAKRMEEEAGVFLHLQISPYKVKPTQEGIIKHYEKVAEFIEGKIIMYSVPSRTGGLGILPETAAELAKHEKIVAIKEASGNYDKNLERTKKILELTKGLDFVVLSGDDSKTYDLIGAGGGGVISVAANVKPYLVSKMTHLALMGDERNLRKSKELDEKLKPLYDVLFVETNPIPLHYALEKIGINAGIPRLPLTEATQETKKKIDEVLSKFEN